MDLNDIDDGDWNESTSPIGIPENVHVGVQMTATGERSMSLDRRRSPSCCMLR